MLDVIPNPPYQAIRFPSTPLHDFRKPFREVRRFNLQKEPQVKEENDAFELG